MRPSTLPIVFSLLASLLFASPLLAQSITVHFTVSPELDTFPISPYIYGSNDQSDDSTAGLTARRSGGNRWTGYNWENNASNAGTDYLNESDNFMTYTLPVAIQHDVATVPIDFHQRAKKAGAYSLITLPAAGYVAADIKGVVSAAEVAPSARWKQVKFAKGSPFGMKPDTTDAFVYDDEEVNYLTQLLGKSDNGGIRGYDCDNEPALWPSTHPRIHPSQTTCAEVISRDSALGLAVKAVDPHAEIFGLVAYGFAEYTNNQSATDWKNYSSYGNWISAYLAKMHDAERSAGKRLVDVLDLHWYPEAQGKTAANALLRITGTENADAGVARARMDAPRSLWDSTYTENSWIGQYYSPVALLPWLNASIAKNYPGTKLSFSEFDYGAEQSISGAIATADVLGIFGKYHVYMSNHWGTIGSYLASAYKIYRNYDAKYSAFGDISTRATTDKIDSTSIYSARRSNDPDHLDIIAINKSSNATVTAIIAIASPTTFSDARAFMLQASSVQIKEQSPISTIAKNSFSYSLPPLSITHFVLTRGPSAVATAEAARTWSIHSANLRKNVLTITFDGKLSAGAHVTLRDILGRPSAAFSIQNLGFSNGPITQTLTSALSSGAYFLTVESAGISQSVKLFATPGEH